MLRDLLLKLLLDLLKKLGLLDGLTPQPGQPARQALTQADVEEALDDYLGGEAEGWAARRRKRRRGR